MERIRVEVDLPVVIINQFGNFVLDNHRALSDALAHYYNHGDVVTVHIVAESTGETREFCTFVDQTSTYKSKCSQVLSPAGVCWMETEHEKSRVKQLTLEEVK